MQFRSSLFLNIGFSLWIVSVIVICILVFIAPMKRSVVPVYHEAVENWMAHRSLYLETEHAYFYFPQFALIFTPFHYLPVPFGDIFWRIFQTALLVTGIWRMVNLSASSDKELFFLCVSVIAIAASIGAIRNGQANVLIAALMVHSAVSLARSHYWLAASWIIFALAVKPIVLVMIFLSVLVYHSIIPRLVIAFFLMVLLPFLFTDSAYVISQYGEALKQLSSSSLTTEHRFADLNGLLRSLGIGLTGLPSQGVRIIAGISFAVLWWTGARRLTEPERSLLLLAFSATYLMLFNPMTESNSYVIVIPIVAYYAVHYLKVEIDQRLGWSLAFMGLSIGLLPELFRPWIQNMSLWWKPLMMFFFSFFLVWKAFRTRRLPATTQSTASGA